MIFAVLAIGTGVAMPELWTTPIGSTATAASPLCGHGKAGAGLICWLEARTGVAAMAGKGRKYWTAAAMRSRISR
jgi:hypothetical protein